MDIPAYHYAQTLIQQQISALEQLTNLDETAFERAINAMQGQMGHVITTGTGKSGIIANKFSATLSSTGTPSFHINPAEAHHGDCGAITKNDLLFAISYSGNSQELLMLSELAKSHYAIPVIAMTRSDQSPLARAADIHLKLPVVTELCHLNLAPSSSSTCCLVLCDALAMTLSKIKGLTPDAFSRNHQAGSLGFRLTRPLSDIMRTNQDIPTVLSDSTVSDAIIEMNEKRVGCTLVVDQSGRLLGVFTDGDLRRSIGQSGDFNTARISNLMIDNPICISADTTIDQALKKMTERQVSVIVCLDSDNRPIGITHIQDVNRLI